jgi:cytochrome b involved in lipid metabolism
MSSTAPAATDKVFTLEEVATHNTEKDCWIIIHNKVYAVTEFLDEHPGGPDIISEQSGVDVTEE